MRLKNLFKKRKASQMKQLKSRKALIEHTFLHKKLVLKLNKKEFKSQLFMVNN